MVGNIQGGIDMIDQSRTPGVMESRFNEWLSDHNDILQKLEPKDCMLMAYMAGASQGVGDAMSIAKSLSPEGDK